MVPVGDLAVRWRRSPARRATLSSFDQRSSSMTSQPPDAPASSATRSRLRAWLRTILFALLIGAAATWADVRFGDPAVRPPLTGRRWLIGAVIWGIGLLLFNLL